VAENELTLTEVLIDILVLFFATSPMMDSVREADERRCEGLERSQRKEMGRDLERW